MKDTILKIAKCKDGTSLYKKFPTEESFLKVHGKELKKALLGDKIKSSANGITDRIEYENYPTQMMSPRLPSNEQPSLKSWIDPYINNQMMSPRGGGALPVNLNNILTPMKGGNDWMNQNIGAIANTTGELIEGFQALGAEKKKNKQLHQAEKVTGLQLQASQTMPEQIQRKYVTPWDNITIGEELFPIGGTGTNPLGKYGISIPKAANGFAGTMNAGGTDIANNLVGKAFDNNAGYQLGSSVGNAVKFIPGVGPVVSAIASPILGAIGGGIDELFGNAGENRSLQRGVDKNIRGITGNQFGQGIHQQYNQNMEDGGNINPQLIKQFGNINMDDLQRISQQMRTGGNIRQNNMNGDLQTYDEGYAEPISYNPYLPDGGETVMFRGPSHVEGGMDVTYGKNPVEVEGGEPAVKLEDGGGQDNLVVFGNLAIPKFGKDVIGDKNATGKFKNYIANLSKKEEKANKTINTSTGKLENIDMNTSFDKLVFNSHKLNVKGADMKLKDIADKKTKASLLQEAINSTAEQYGIVADDLARGKIKKAKKGISINKTYGDISKYSGKGVHRSLGYNLLDDKTGRQYDINGNLIESISSQQYNSDKYNIGLLSGMPVNATSSTISDNKDNKKNKYDKEKFPWIQAINSVIPYFRPSDAEPLDYNQLSGELNALSNNQLEPVQAQTYSPQLDVPYNVSLQDIRNENQADYRGVQRMMGGNPAAQAILNAQKYAANQKVGGEEFRLNQTMKDKVFSGNRTTLNDAQLKNLGIYDNQYTRQEQAKSNTKAVTQAALSSISDKYAKNKLENKTLQAYENLYNYRYDNQGRAINMNPLAQFNTEGATTNSNKNTGFNFAPGYEGEYDGQGRLIGTKVIKKTKSPVDRNGGIVKAMKNL